MGRQQCKNPLNSIKSKPAPPETSGSATARPQQLNADEAENYLKNNFMKMTEALKEEIKNSLKVEEKTNKKLEEINKSLKENQEKAIKQVKETVQDLKGEIEAIKKI